MKEKVLLFGTGSCANKTANTLDEDSEIIGFIDNDKKKAGTLFLGKPVISPSQIAQQDYDKILICSSAGHEIRSQLWDMPGIEMEKIVNNYYFHKKRMLDFYKKGADGSWKEDMQPVLDYIEEHDLSVFNAEFVKKYPVLPVEVFWDSHAELYYGYYCNKKMYLAKKYNTEEKARNYIRGILMEQDPDSPHKYLTEKFTVSEGDVVLDAGVAEGNFALEVIDKAKKVYLVEADEEWIDALRYTFSPYQDKVRIINAFLTDVSGGSNITVDEIRGENEINFIKLDIEGEELKALRGAEKTLEKDRNLKLAVCAYHNVKDEEEITRFLDSKGYQTEPSGGYMVFILSENYYQRDTKKLVRGLLRAEKKKFSGKNYLIYGCGKSAQ